MITPFHRLRAAALPPLPPPLADLIVELALALVGAACRGFA